MKQDITILSYSLKVLTQHCTLWTYQWVQVYKGKAAKKQVVNGSGEHNEMDGTGTDPKKSMERRNKTGFTSQLKTMG
jgi:hypothetical protein